MWIMCKVFSKHRSTYTRRLLLENFSYVRICVCHVPTPSLPFASPLFSQVSIPPLPLVASPTFLFSSLRFVLSCSRATFLHSSFRVYDSLARCLCAIFNWSPWTLSAFLTLEMANVSTFARKVHAIYMHVRTVRKSQILCLFLHFPNDSANTHPHTHICTRTTLVLDRFFDVHHFLPPLHPNSSTLAPFLLPFHGFF